ncbi:MAG: hypothetical protein KJ749_04650, partial [Planctomycetes bacterium]|nr:hypothetical protein [Planctomycetota bacterium]
ASPVTADNQPADKPTSEDEDLGAAEPDRGQSADSQDVADDEPPILPIDQGPTPRAAAPHAGFVGAVLPADKDDPEESSGVPVPWRRHGGRATRSAPGRTRAASTFTGTGEPEAEGSADHRPAAPITSEPLLTEAELRALIGDDVSAIAPRGPADGRTTDEPNKGGLS